VKEYGEGQRAHRVAYAALKHTYEKVGDHWEPKSSGAEGVNVNASKKHLMDMARRLDISGRSSMDKSALVSAIKKANRRETSRKR
jgi:ChaB